MGISLFSDIETGIRSFFSSLAASLSFELIFALGIIVQLAIIAFFVIKSEFSYELRTTRALDKLNKWLFINKRLGTENIKEFTDMLKKAPKRLSHNWQQYILYREKSPSEYMSVENCIEKPLRTSSFSSNLKNLTWVSIFWTLLSLLLGLSYASQSGEAITGSMIIISAITPILIVVAWVITMVSLRARKNANLDELYQNHHLFQRFIDNACVDLPPFIDFSLLFTVEEIEKGIPALREYLENRARKEKEEFERAKREMVVYEKYSFEDAGVDGSNILERAMNESEAYLSKKDKTLAKISQFEASLESLKRNFDNIQKDFQKKMQVSKENIDRLRQQQEETTSRIESNFLRKQQAVEIAKQEKEEADFEQQKRRYLVEKNDYEEAVAALNTELEGGKEVVEEAMKSEYQTFYERICKSAYKDVEEKVKTEIINLKETVDVTEDELAKAQTTLKRLQDENATLKKKLNVVPIVAQANAKEEKKEEVKIEEVVFGDQDITSKPKKEFIFGEEEISPKPKTEVVFEDVVAPVKENKPAPVAEIGIESILQEAKKKGRPRKVVTEEPKEKKGRGRPVGSRKKANSPSVKKRSVRGAKKVEVVEVPQEKRGRGRPSKEVKTGGVDAINKKIDEEAKKMKKLQEKMNNQIEEAINGLENVKSSKENDKLGSEIDSLKAKAQTAKTSTSTEEVDEVSKRIEDLLKQIKSGNSNK